MSSGPGGREVGRISVRVLPDTSKFGVSLEKYLKRMEARLRLDIPVSLDQAGVAASEQELAILTKDRQVNIHTNVDKSQLDMLTTAVGKVTSGAGGFGGGGGLFGMGPAASIALIGGIAALLPILGGALASIPGIIALIAAPIAVIALGLEGIKSAAAGLLQPFLTLKQILANEFLGTLAPTFQMFKDLLPAITPGLVSIAAALGGFFAAIASALTSGTGVQLLQQIFDGIAQAIWILTPLMGPIVTLFLQFAQAFTQALVAQGPAFTQAMTDVITMFTNLVASGAVTQAIQLFLQFTTGLLKATFQLVALLIQIAAFVIQANAWWLTFKANALAWISQTMSGIVTAIQAKLAEAVAWFRGLPGRITGALGDPKTLLFNAGKFLIGGLIDGIMSMLGPVGTAIGAIAGVIKDHFPGSPVKTGPLTSWNGGGAGKRLGSMLASGLTASTSDVRSAARGLAGGVALNDPASALAGAGAGGAGVVQNFHGNILAQDMSSFQRDMAQRRRAAAYSTTRRAQ